tara:strand:- start:275 stop:511 length:237 start_codon:yes stop_codon:yes gene_type:complete
MSEPYIPQCGQLIRQIFTDEFSDIVTKEVMREYYEINADFAAKHIEEEDCLEVMAALTVLLKQFMTVVEFKEWLEERS